MKEKVHVVGIGGPGASAAAVLLQHAGYSVSGCDSASDPSPYLEAAASRGIPLFHEHSISHVHDHDFILTALGANFTASPILEVEQARHDGKLTTWQQFLGQRILPKFNVIAVSGSHGKTTTGAAIASVLLGAGRRPSALLGDTVIAWGTHVLSGDGQEFILEADEKTMDWYPADVLVITNIDFEHPEHFSSKEEFVAAFRRMILKLPESGSLIYNGSDREAGILIDSLIPLLQEKRIKVVDFTLLSPKFCSISSCEANSLGGKGQVSIELIGAHNRSNMQAAYVCATMLGVDAEETRSILSRFRGVKARLELKYSSPSVVFYSDYAHHPTELAAGIEAVKECHPERKVVVVYEPHQVTRTQVFWPETVTALRMADFSIILNVYKGREPLLEIDVERLIVESELRTARFCHNEFELRDIVRWALTDCVILLAAAGNGLRITKLILDELNAQQF